MLSPSSTKPQVRKGSLLLVSLGTESLRLECVRVLEHRLHARRHCGRGDDDVSLGDDILATFWS